MYKYIYIYVIVYIYRYKPSLASAISSKTSHRLFCSPPSLYLRWRDGAPHSPCRIWCADNFGSHRKTSHNSSAGSNKKQIKTKAKPVGQYIYIYTYTYTYTVKLGEALSSPKPFLLPVILRPCFWGGFLAPFLGPRKSKQSCLTVLTARISSICWRQPSFCNASRHNTIAQKLFWISEKVHFPGPQEAMLTSCALAACRLYNAYVRKLFCVHLGRSVWRALVAVHPARFGIYYSIRPKR